MDSYWANVGKEIEERNREKLLREKKAQAVFVRSHRERVTLTRGSLERRKKGDNWLCTKCRKYKSRAAFVVLKSSFVKAQCNACRRKKPKQAVS